MDAKETQQNEPSASPKRLKLEDDEYFIPDDKAEVLALSHEHCKAPMRPIDSYERVVLVLFNEEGLISAYYTDKKLTNGEIRILNLVRNQTGEQDYDIIFYDVSQTRAADRREYLTNPSAYDNDYEKFLKSRQKEHEDYVKRKTAKIMTNKPMKSEEVPYTVFDIQCALMEVLGHGHVWNVTYNQKTINRLLSSESTLPIVVSVWR